jgi:hypothetical protein
MRITRFRICMSLAALVCVFLFSPLSGCEMFESHINPVPYWSATFDQLEQLSKNKVISNDYQDYIKRNIHEPKEFVGEIRYLQDGTGQHAVTIEVGSNGTYRTHVLIYDVNNKRIKVKKYISGHYAC